MASGVGHDAVFRFLAGGTAGQLAGRLAQVLQGFPAHPFQLFALAAECLVRRGQGDDHRRAIDVAGVIGLKPAHPHFDQHLIQGFPHRFQPVRAVSLFLQLVEPGEGGLEVGDQFRFTA